MHTAFYNAMILVVVYGTKKDTSSHLN